MPGGKFYIDLEKRTSFRYDISKLMEFNEGVYDEFTSYFIEEMRKLPANGRVYTIKEDNRPDIYSADIYGSTDFWYILLLYNNLVLMSDMKRGTELRFPSQAGLENLYTKLKAEVSR